jgi:hypothetical protein
MRSALVALLLTYAGCNNYPEACLSGKDCNSGCCAPLTDKDGNRVGPYACQKSDACCTDPLFNPCPGADKCTSNADCSGGAACNAYSFANTTCSGSTACGPDL